MNFPCRVVLLAVTLFGLAAQPAGAELFAAVNVAAPAPRSDVDVAVLNASTGARVTLPAGTNTTADELHPGISTNGTRLTFQRVDRVAGTVRIVVVELSTARSADLFSGFEVAARVPNDPAISPSGNTVYTGGAFDQPPGQGSFSHLIVPTSLVPFPTPPFVHGAIRTGYNFVAPGTATDISSGAGELLASKEERAGFRGELILTQIGGGSTFPLARSTATYANPALAAGNALNVLFDVRPVNADGVVGRGDIAFRPATLTGFLGAPTLLPPIVNSLSLDESQPAQSSDGRYVAFVRHGVDGHDRLFVWDSQTQTLLNSGGVDLGAITTRDVGAVTLYNRLVFATSQLTLSGGVNLQLLQSAGVGLLVQRIKGFQRVLRRKAYVLGPPRRVPLGTFTKGRHRVKWDFRVGGRRLAPGRYLVTIRAVTPKRVVRELGGSRVITIPPT